MSESFSVDQLIDWSTTLITEVLNSRMALTDDFESREPVDNLSLKHNVILSPACKSWTLCWQCFLKRLLSICRNLKSPSLTITMQEHVHGTAWHVADGYFSRPVPLASSISGIPVWRVCCEGCHNVAFSILLNPPDFPLHWFPARSTGSH